MSLETDKPFAEGDLHNSDHTANSCLRLMLHKWLKRAIPPPTWEELAEAVESTDQTIVRKIRRT